MGESLISVIIPCYNNGKFLAKAIESVLSQSYKHYEIIVVDDGSTDDTKEITDKYPDVEYVYQMNQGPSAARNKGIEKSKGNYLIFLDADDWLLPDAFDINLRYLKNPTAALVSGAHEIFYESDNTTWLVEISVIETPYCHLLEKNYIAMIAAALFQRWIFDLYNYDVTLRGCEDYDLYLKIARSHQIVSHTEAIAVYRFHKSNSSNNYLLMLESALLVLKKQQNLLISDQEKLWYEKGFKFWKEYYSKYIYLNMITTLQQGKKVNNFDLKVLKKYNRDLYEKFNIERVKSVIKKPLKLFKTVLKNVFPNIDFRKSNRESTPQPGNVSLGDFNRTQPFSKSFGYERGGPIDRYYIENFLEKNQSVICGRVLEIGDNEYTLRYGGTNVLQSDILHINEDNSKATIIGDLSNAPQIPDDSFDCIILTQTLHLIYDYKDAIKTCYRILKPNGVLLLTVPGITHVDRYEWSKYWLWSFTDNSVQRVLGEYFSAGKTEIEVFGNVLVATAFLYGMGKPELSKEQLDTIDPHYQVIITACAVK